MAILAMVFSFRMTLYFWETDLYALYTTRLNLRIMLSGNRALLLKKIQAYYKTKRDQHTSLKSQSDESGSDVTDSEDD